MERNDEKWMREALQEAQIAYDLGEIPVGAVIVHKGEIIARGHNIREKDNHPSGHAEMVAIEKAGEALGTWRLSGCTLYVTLEPCVMCTGACIVSRLDRIVFGAYDKKAGCCGSIADLTALPLESEPDVFGGILESECQELLQQFFEDIRNES